MSTTEISLTRGQRHTLLAYAIFLGAMAAAAGAWTATAGFGHTGGRSGYGGAIMAAAAFVSACLLADTAFSRVLVTEAGLRIWRPSRRRTVRWDKIAAIEPATARERSGQVFRLVLVTTCGRRIPLPAPVSSWWGLNNDFGRQQAALCGAGRARVGAAPSGLSPGASHRPPA